MMNLPGLPGGVLPQSLQQPATCAAAAAAAAAEVAAVQDASAQQTVEVRLRLADALADREGQDSALLALANIVPQQQQQQQLRPPARHTHAPAASAALGVEVVDRGYTSTTSTTTINSALLDMAASRGQYKQPLSHADDNISAGGGATVGGDEMSVLWGDASARHRDLHLVHERYDPGQLAEQRHQWNLLRDGISNALRQLKDSTIIDVIGELLQCDLVRGRGLFAAAVMRTVKADSRSVMRLATVVSVINARIPPVGDILLKKVVAGFVDDWKARRVGACRAAAHMLCALVKVRVVHDFVGLQLIVMLLESERVDEAAVDVLSLLLSSNRGLGRYLDEVGTPEPAEVVFGRVRELLQNLGSSPDHQEGVSSSSMELEQQRQQEPSGRDGRRSGRGGRVGDRRRGRNGHSGRMAHGGAYCQDGRFVQRVLSELLEERRERLMYMRGEGEGKGGGGGDGQSKQRQHNHHRRKCPGSLRFPLLARTYDLVPANAAVAHSIDLMDLGGDDGVAIPGGDCRL